MKRILITTLSALMLAGCSTNQDNEEESATTVEDTPSYEESKRAYSDKLETLPAYKENFNLADESYLKNDPYHSENVDGVYTDILGVSHTRNNTKEIHVYFDVRNTTDAEHSIPLVNAVLVTESGAQSYVNASESLPPEWNLYPNARDKGVITFDPVDDPDFDVGSKFTIHIPGVDFKKENDWEWNMNY